MITSDLLDRRKLVLLLVCGLLLVGLLRAPVLSRAIWTNGGMLVLNQQPLWQSILQEVEVKEGVGIRQALERNSEDEVLWQAQGMLHFARGNESEALGTWIEGGIEPAQVALQQGHYAQFVGRDDVALAWYEYAVVLNPGQAEAWHEMGALYEARGDIEAAVAAYERAFELGNPESADPLARIWRDRGRYDKAIAVWREALDTYTSHETRLEWWRGLTNSLRATDQWEIGVDAAERALREFPEDARLHVEYGVMVYYGWGNVEPALEALGRAVELDKEMVDAYGAAGAIMAREGQFSAAYDWYSRAIDADPKNASSYVARGHMARAAGDYALALSAFEEAIARFPEFAPAHHGIAVIHQELGEKVKAENAIRRALALDGGNRVNYYLRAGEIYEWNGKLTDAAEAYRLALELDPGNQVAASALRRIRQQEE